MEEQRESRWHPIHFGNHHLGRRRVAEQGFGEQVGVGRDFVRQLLVIGQFVDKGEHQRRITAAREAQFHAGLRGGDHGRRHRINRPASA